MAIKTIPLSHLQTDLAGTLNECAELGHTFVVELPNQQLVAIQALGPNEDDSLIDELLASGPESRALLTRSKSGPRQSFPASEVGL